MAEHLGRSLLAEIEETGGEELLASLRLASDLTAHAFGCLPLDHLLKDAGLGSTSSTNQPVVELTSTSPGGGSTHLLYHLVAIAIVHGCHRASACVVVLDTEGHFDIKRLTAHVKSHLASTKASDNLDEEEDSDTIVQLLKHVHLFRPQSLGSTIATLETLTEHMFDAKRHHSINRMVAFIALDSASTFYWSTRAAEEEQRQHDTHLPRPTVTAKKTLSLWHQLTNTLRAVSHALSCPLILTSHPHTLVPPASSQGPQNTPQIIRSLRPCLPTPLSLLPTLRLVLQRTPIKKFPAGISVEEATLEAADRLQAVEDGRFEIVANEWQSDDLSRGRTGGFAFNITNDGLSFNERMSSGADGSS